MRTYLRVILCRAGEEVKNSISWKEFSDYNSVKKLIRFNNFIIKSWHINSSLM